MNIILAPGPAKTSGWEFEPDSPAQDHLREILKVKVGDVVKVGIPCGQQGLAQVVLSESKRYRLRFLPLIFKSGTDVIDFVTKNRLQKPEKDSEDEKESDKNDGENPVKEQGSTEKGSTEKGSTEEGSALPERYIFPPLNQAQLELWDIHPYEPYTRKFLVSEENGSEENGSEENGGRIFSDDTDMLSRKTWDSIRLSKDGPLPVSESPQPVIDLLLAVPRPRVFDKLLEYLGSMSIGRIVFFMASRSDLAYFSSPKMSVKSIESTLRKGQEQGKRTYGPNVEIYGSLKSAIERLDQNKTYLPLIAHPYAVGDLEPQSMLTVDSVFSHTGEYLLVLGPEGGFTETEANMLMNGFTGSTKPQLVSLGPDILRYEVATLQMLGQISLILNAPPSLREGTSKRNRNDLLPEKPLIFLSQRGTPPSKHQKIRHTQHTPRANAPQANAPQANGAQVNAPQADAAQGAQISGAASELSNSQPPQSEGTQS